MTFTSTQHGHHSAPAPGHVHVWSSPKNKKLHSARTTTRSTGKTATGTATSGTKWNRNLNHRSRIPLQSSPYIGYLRHAPSASFYLNKCKRRSSNDRHFSSYSSSSSSSSAWTFASTSASVAAAAVRTLKRQQKQHKSSPYVGFMRHAPPSQFTTTTRINNTNSSTSKSSSSSSSSSSVSLTKKKNTDFLNLQRVTFIKEHNLNHNYAQQQQQQDDDDGIINFQKNEIHNSTKTTSTTMTLYPKHYQNVSGRLLGGNPLHHINNHYSSSTSYSFCRWFEATTFHNDENDTSTTTTTSSRNRQQHNQNRHNYDHHNHHHNPIETLELFHIVASWFLFPLAYSYDENMPSFITPSSSSSTLLSLSLSSPVHIPTLDCLASFVKRLLLRRDVLFLCTGVENNINIQLQQQQPSHTLEQQQQRLQSNEEVLVSSNTVNNSSNNNNNNNNNNDDDDINHTSDIPQHADNEHTNLLSSTSSSTSSSSSFPLNHPLHVSVSSLAKAYYVEQTRLEFFSSVDDVNVDDDVDDDDDNVDDVDNNNNNNNRMYTSMTNDEFQRHLDVESILKLPTITYYNTKSKSKKEKTKKKMTELFQNDNDNDDDHHHDHHLGQKDTLEWSWIAVPKDPSTDDGDGEEDGGQQQQQQQQQELEEEEKDQNEGIIKQGGEIFGGAMKSSASNAAMSSVSSHNVEEEEEDGDDEEDTNQDDEHCVICLEQFKDGDRLRVLPCNHRFHTRCIDKWLSGSSSYKECFTKLCPTCKKMPNVSGTLSNSTSFEIGEDDSMGTMGTMGTAGEEMRVEGHLPSWAFTRLGGSIAKEN